MIYLSQVNMRYLITGVSGFVGGHFLEHIFARHPGSDVVGVDTERAKFDFLNDLSKKKINFHRGSLLNKKLISGLIKKFKPDYIINLASYSSVAYSWKRPAECFINNTGIFLNLVESARKSKIKTKILSVGSSEEYGIVSKKNIPITEKSRLNPANPYAAARAAQERISRIYADGFKVPIICTRSFNHIGPRQKDIFAISSFAKQIIEAKSGKRKEITCGNLKIVRDFMDVRDVVRAYDLLLRKGGIGQVYNVCSGRGYELSEILGMLQKKAGTNLPVTAGPGLTRLVDSPVIIGSPEKLERETGFRREYTLSNSLKDVLNYWDGKQKKGGIT